MDMKAFAASFGLSVGLLICAYVASNDKIPAPLLALEKRFESQIWPILNSNGCVACHTSGKGGPLELPKAPRDAFYHLVDEGYFDAAQPMSLAVRLTEQENDRVMPPPPLERCEQGAIDRIVAFSAEVMEAISSSGIDLKREPPLSARIPYVGAKPDPGETPALTYYQLKQKILALFGDDWVRDGKDRWAESAALFGGADFHKSFSESNRITAQYLTGVDRLAKDVVSRAYLNAAGPFQGLSLELADPRKLKSVDAQYKAAIRHLYRRLLFRDPSVAEETSSFKLVQSVYANESRLMAEESEIAFEVVATDRDGMKASATVSMTLLNSELAVYQEEIDQSEGKGVVVKKLQGTFLLKKGDVRQSVRIDNAETEGVVSVFGIETAPVGGGAKRIKANDRSVRAEGAWKRDGDGYHDNDESKGANSIVFPLAVDQDGEYEIALVYKVFGDRYMSKRTVVEVANHSRRQIQEKRLEETGVGAWLVDQSDDARPHWQPNAKFRFTDAGHGVTISNANTRKEVSADAVRFVPDRGEPILVRSTEAKGHEDWAEFKHKSFEAYNTVGPKLLSDENKRKGELTLRYSPVGRSGWSQDALYRVQVVYPGKQFSETRVPVTISAAFSTPILRIARPLRVQVGQKAVIQAEARNVQASPIALAWKQIGGPKVALKASASSTIEFVAPKLSPKQAAWEALAQALMRHPDFLLSRPPSLDAVKDSATIKRLRLVWIAQDLAGRPPTDQEVARLDRGESFAQLIDAYLASDEFDRFFIRRVRLYLESRGSDEDEEPVRLWRYVLNNGRAVAELLTADYTVGTNGEKRERPAQHGKTGLLTMKGFMNGKPGLPHFNYAAIVAEKFLDYSFEVPPEIVEARQTATAAGTTDPKSSCYSCHKVLTPLAYQRLRWKDDGTYAEQADGKAIDDTDRGAVASYPFKGRGMEAFAAQAVESERFARAMINVHFLFMNGRLMRWQTDERETYLRLRATYERHGGKIKPILKAILLERVAR